MLEGAMEQKILHITYESEKAITERDIQLVGLYSMNGKWYCPAYDFQSTDYRLFRANRIKAVSISPNQTRKKVMTTCLSRIGSIKSGNVRNIKRNMNC
nr:WYL domain-containing protein [Paenibacillus hamazuiensis]